MSEFSNRTTMPSWLYSAGYINNLYSALKGLEVGTIQLDIFGLRTIVSNDFEDEAIVETGSSEKASGGILASQGVIGSLNRVNAATDKAARVVLKSNTTGEFQFPTVVLPYDLDDAEAMTVHLLTRMAGATDTTTTIDVQAFFGVGDTECGGATSALTNVLAQKSVALAAGDVPAYPGALNIMLVPGTHANDAIWIYGAWVTYTRKPR